MVPQDESVSGVISAPTQEVGMEALPSGAGLEPVSAVGVAEGCERDVECSFSMASMPSATTLPVFQTGEFSERAVFSGYRAATSFLE